MVHRSLPPLALAAALLAACQAPPAAVDPQSGLEPRSEAGAGQQLLARMVGDFDVDKTFCPRQGEPVHSRGRCRQSMVQGGRFLQSEFVFSTEQGDSTGLGLIGFDAATGRFTSCWIDSRSTRFSLRQSEGAFDGEQIELVGKVLQGSAPGRASRTVTRLAADGRQLVHRQFGPTDDGGERLVMELVMTRR